MSQFQTLNRCHILSPLCCVILFFLLCIMPAGAFAQEEPQAILQISADKETFRPGDIAVITLKSGDFQNFNGRIHLFPIYLTISFDGDIWAYEDMVWHVNAVSMPNHTPTEAEPYWAGNIEIDSGLGPNAPVFTLYLQVKEDAEEGNTALHLSSRSAPVGTDMQGSLIPITYEDTSVQIDRPLSSDNTLHHLDLGGISLSPRFDPYIFQYTANVPHHVLSVPLYYEADEHATVRLFGSTENLSPGENTVCLQITAEDGSQKAYVLTIIRALPSTLPPDTTTTTSAAPSVLPSTSRPSSSGSSSKPPGSSLTTSGTTVPSAGTSEESPSPSSTSPGISYTSPSIPAGDASSSVSSIPISIEPSSTYADNPAAGSQSAITGENMPVLSSQPTTHPTSNDTESKRTFDIRYLPVLPLLLLIFAVIVYLIRRNHHDSETPPDDGHTN